MKASYVVIVAAVLGAAFGAGASWATFHHSPPMVTIQRQGLPTDPGAKARPKALVDQVVFDFGPVERDTKAEHVFQITNMGEAPLKLEAGATSCTRCTIAELSKSTLAPGETADVKIVFDTSHASPRFRQRAEIKTNDPDKPIIDLYIVGTMTNTYQVVPQWLVLSKISANERKTGEIKIYSYLTDEVGVEKYEFTGAGSAAYFEVATQPIPRDQLKEPRARSGCLVLVTLKPGLPLGAIRQTIRLELKMGDRAENTVVEVPIEGTIDSDISVVGRGWDAVHSRLRMGDIKSSTGVEWKGSLILRGPHRHDVTIKPQSADPAWLKVTLGEKADVSTGVGREGGVTRIPLTIEIPPGTPPANHLGSDQGKYGEVILETTHPDVKQIRMYLQFVVVN